MDLLPDFMEGGMNFKVVGDPLISSYLIKSIYTCPWAVLAAIGTCKEG